MRHISYLALLNIFFLAGCQGVNPVADTVLSQFNSRKLVNYSAGFEYLLVGIHGREVTMALGVREVRDGALHEFWYSGQREMLHLCDGRITEVVGMTQELRYSSKGTPSWDELMQSGRPLVWSRSRDSMPGYRVGLTEFVISQRVTPTPEEAKAAGQAAMWVEEEIKSKKLNGANWIYREQFAISDGRVVYSKQCITPELCFELKPLGVVNP